MDGKSTEPNGAKEAGMDDEKVSKDHVFSLLMVIEGTIRELAYRVRIDSATSNTLELSCKFFRQELDKQ